MEVNEDASACQRQVDSMLSVVSLKPLPKSFLQKPLSLSHMYRNYCQSGLRVRGSLKINKSMVSENHTGIISLILYGCVGSHDPVFSFMAKPNASRKVLFIPHFSRIHNHTRAPSSSPYSVTIHLKNCSGFKPFINMHLFTFTVLAEDFIQRDLQCIQHIHFITLCVF